MVERESPKFLVWVRFPPLLSFFVSVAQLVEQATVNREVIGSSPIRDVFLILLYCVNFFCALSSMDRVVVF